MLVVGGVYEQEKILQDRISAARGAGLQYFSSLMPNFHGLSIRFEVLLVTSGTFFFGLGAYVDVCFPRS